MHGAYDNFSSDQGWSAISCNNATLLGTNQLLTHVWIVSCPGVLLPQSVAHNYVNEMVQLFFLLHQLIVWNKQNFCTLSQPITIKTAGLYLRVVKNVHIPDQP